MVKAEHRIEECLKRGKSEAGLGDYQVRNWEGWHNNHQALSLIAMWFLVLEARRGKKSAGVDGPAGARGSGADLPQGVPVRYRGTQCA